MTVDGIGEGTFVGLIDGRALKGRSEGCLEGTTDGICVGLFLGGDVIIVVGLTVGCEVHGRTPISTRNEAFEDRHEE